MNIHIKLFNRLFRMIAKVGIVSLMCTYMYMTVSKLHPSTDVQAFLKLLPIVLLGLLCFKSGISSASVLVSTGLALSAAGDYFLAYDGSDNFIKGLICFFSAHICYVIYFWSPYANAKKSPSIKIRYALGLLIPFYFLQKAFLFGVPADMKIPVILYCVIIYSMWWRSIARHDILSIVGATFFVVSDCTLASVEFGILKEYFGPRSPMASFLIMSTYYAAQFFITLALLKERKIASQTSVSQETELKKKK